MEQPIDLILMLNLLMAGTVNLGGLYGGLQAVGALASKLSQSQAEVLNRVYCAAYERVVAENRGDKALTLGLNRAFSLGADHMQDTFGPNGEPYNHGAFTVRLRELLVESVGPMAGSHGDNYAEKFLAEWDIAFHSFAYAESQLRPVLQTFDGWLLRNRLDMVIQRLGELGDLEPAQRHRRYAMQLLVHVQAHYPEQIACWFRRTTPVALPLDVMDASLPLTGIAHEPRSFTRITREESINRTDRDERPFARSVDRVLQDTEVGVHLEGGAGTGKTTMLRWLTHMHAESFGLDGNVVPIYVDLGDMVAPADSSIDALATRFLFEHARVDATTEAVLGVLAIRHLRELGVRFVFFLDGLDRGYRKTVEVREFVRKCVDEHHDLVVLSSRPGYYKPEGLLPVRLIGVETAARQIEFLARYEAAEPDHGACSPEECVSRARAKRSDITKLGIAQDILTNPLRLWMAWRLAYTLDPATNLADLYGAFVEYLLERKTRSGNPLGTTTRASALSALERFWFESKTCDMRANVSTQDMSWDQLRLFEELDNETSLLEYRPPYPLRMLHPSFEEYFAATFMSRLPSQSLIEVIENAANKNEWRDTIIFMAGMLTPDARESADILDRLLELDPRLLFACLRQMGPASVADRSHSLIQAGANRASVLEACQNWSELGRLAFCTRGLESGDAANALATREDHDDVTHEQLLAVLRDRPGTHAANGAARGFVQADVLYADVREALLVLLRDRPRTNAAGWAGSLVERDDLDDEMRDALFAVLRERPDTAAAAGVAFSLSQRDDLEVDVRDVLLALLRDRPGTRAASEAASGLAGRDELELDVRNVLLALLRDHPETEAARSAASGLAKRAEIDPEVREVLVALLRDRPGTNAAVGAACLSERTEIDADLHEVLVTLLGDRPETNAAQWVAMLLGWRVEDDAAMFETLTCLVRDHPETDAARAAASSLVSRGELGQGIRAMLIATLRDRPGTDAAETSARALTERNEVEAEVRTVLIGVLHERPETREAERIASYLGRWGAPDAEIREILLSLLRNQPKTQAARGAASGLAGRDDLDDDVRAVVLSLLRDQPESLAAEGAGAALAHRDELDDDVRAGLLGLLRDDPETWAARLAADELAERVELHDDVRNGLLALLQDHPDTSAARWAAAKLGWREERDDEVRNVLMSLLRARPETSAARGAAFGLAGRDEDCDDLRSTLVALLRESPETLAAQGAAHGLALNDRLDGDVREILLGLLREHPASSAAAGAAFGLAAVDGRDSEIRMALISLLRESPETEAASEVAIAFAFRWELDAREREAFEEHELHRSM